MKERLDKLVTALDTSLSREKAKALIMAGEVYVNGQREDKAGTMVDEHAQIEIRSGKLPFVSRGGLKLQKAFEVFGLSVEDQVCIDAGASTGGFTDCMLQHGAQKVYAIDVGYGQLDWSLRQDKRVVCMEKTNVRYITSDLFEEEIGFSSADLSFISLTKVLPAIYACLKDGAEAVVLVKPQFEAGREQVGKKGVVRDPKVHESVIYEVADCAYHIGFHAKALTYSPVKGPEGNIEYLLWLGKEPGRQYQDADVISPAQAAKVVREAFEVLNC